MAKKRDAFSFNFGANAKGKKARKGKSKKSSSGKKGKGNAWRAYVGSNAPIPD